MSIHLGVFRTWEPDDLVCEGFSQRRVIRVEKSYGYGYAFSTLYAAEISKLRGYANIPISMFALIANVYLVTCMTFIKECLRIITAGNIERKKMVTQQFIYVIVGNSKTFVLTATIRR